MSTQIIEIEGESLEEARETLKSRFPEGLFYVSEKVVSDGKPKAAQGVAETAGAAIARAQSELPAGAAILEKKEVTAPEQKSFTVEAFNEQKAREKLAVQLPKTAIIRTLKLLTPGEKNFLGLRKTPNQYEAEVFQQAVAEIIYRTKAKISAEIRERKASVLKLAGNLSSGVWPAELERDIFDQVDFEKLLARLKDYQEMPHPGSSGIYPSYTRDDQGVGRAKESIEDFKIIKKAACVEDRGTLGPLDAKTSDYAFAVVCRYAHTPLAFFLFMLPTADRINLTATGETSNFFVGDIKIEAYKGVENLLFEICEELEEGQVFTDETVTKKLLSILEGAKK